MPDLPTGTVTFLFTDLESSTRLWEEHPETMKDALARHDAILREAIAAHDGHVVKTSGDGFHAAFPDARSAVLSARDAQLALEAESWDTTGPLRVRMGLHTCQADVRDGDYYGSAVNRAARLMSIAHGGQVVLSLATEELTREALSRDVTLVDLGEHRLRDLTHAERVFQLSAPGLPQDFAPLQSLDALPTNLPRQLTSFIGRDDELEAIADALTRVSLVTLTGVGGVGKTRLATQVAAHVAPDYRDGVWMCELAGVNDGDGVVQVVATALGVLPRRDVSLAESVAEFLRTRSTLLVLDNCEHVLDASARLAEMLLQGCPDVRIIATSREGLAVAGEQVFPLRSLPVPGESEGADTIVASDAARLFAERAAMARAGFVIDGTNVHAVAEICRRLDGIPLAIELAAARVSAMRPADIASRLGERFRLLTGGRRTAVERQQTLRATVDWSYSLLTDLEQTVFNRLGVFSGGFEIVSAEAVASGDGLEPWDVVDAVAGLVDKSMVSDDETPAGAARYAMLETLRQYALERLEDAGDIDAWRRRHASHFAEIAEDLRGRLLGPDELAALEALSTELDNYRAAVNWALERDDRDDQDLGIRIISGLASQAYLGANASVGAWAEVAVPHVGETTPEHRSRLLGAAAMAVMARGEHARARDLATTALEDDDDTAGLSAYPYGALSYSQLVSGEYANSIATLVEGERLIRENAPESFDHLHMLMSLSSFRAMDPDDSTALPVAEETMRVARLLGSDYILVHSLLALGMSLQRDNPEAAREAYEEAYAIAQHLRHGIFGSLTSYLAVVRLRTGDLGGALEALRDGFVFFGDTGERPQLVAAVNRAIRVVAASGEHVVAATLVGVANDGPLAALNNFPDSRLEDGHPIVVRLDSDLGDERFTDARRRGAAMNYDEVVDFVLSETDRILSQMHDG